MSYVDPIKESEVVDAKTFAEWAQATIGVPHPTLADKKMLGKKAKDLFENEPGTDWQTLVAVAKWCRSKKRRLARVAFVVDQYRWAYAAGAIDLKVRQDDDLERDLAQALTEEDDPGWVGRLRRATGNEAKREVLSQWRTAHPR